MSNSIPSKVLPNVAPSQMSKLTLGKLTRDQMATLLHACYNEQRAPMMDELHAPTPKKFKVAYTAERTGTGLFDLLDNDALAEVLFRLPTQQRRQSRAKPTRRKGEEKAAFAALSAAIEATATQLSDELYRQLYETGKGR